MITPDASPIPVLLTRPDPAAQAVIDALRAADAPAFAPVTSPAIGIAFQSDLPDVTGAKGVVFTSAHGVTAWRHCGGGTDLPAYAVGRATADAARRVGFDTWSADGDADALIDALAQRRPAAPLVHIHGTHTRGDVANRLTKAGLPTRSIPLYDQPKCAPNPAAQAILSGERMIVAPVFSPRTAAILGSWPRKAPLLVAAMSETVANSLPSHHIHGVRVADHPTLAAMVGSTVELLRTAMHLEAERRHV